MEMRSIKLLSYVAIILCIILIVIAIGIELGR